MTPKERMRQATCPLVMRVGDMALEYELAADPLYQIEIFADLNGCLESRIAWLLREAGCVVDVKKLPRASRKEGCVNFAEIYETSPEAEQARAFRARREAERKEEEEMCMEHEAAAEDAKPVIETVDPAVEKAEPAAEKTESVSETAEPETAGPADIGEGRYFDALDMSAAALRRIRVKEATAGYWSVFLREKFRFAGELSAADVDYMEALCDMALGLAQMMEG